MNFARCLRLRPTLAGQVFIVALALCGHAPGAWSQPAAVNPDPGALARRGSPVLADQAPQSPHWSLGLEAIALTRSNSVDQPLVSRIAGDRTFLQTAAEPGTEAFNSNQFRQGFGIGPKITLGYATDSGSALEVSYFNVLNLSATRTVGPELPSSWYVMKAPGFWQTQDFPYQGMTWGSSTTLFSAEVNAKTKVAPQLKVLAGLRWIQLNDNLIGSLSPADRSAPNWKIAPYPCGFNPSLNAINDACNGGPAVNGYPAFWTTSTTNNLFGLQLGAEGTLIGGERWSLGGVLKAGAYNNNATQSDWVSITKVMYTSGASSNQLAFAGEAALQLRILLADGLVLKFGYQLLWLDKVALAPGQIPQVYSAFAPTSIAATGVNTGSNILFQGGTVGIEYSF